MAEMQNENQYQDAVSFYDDFLDYDQAFYHPKRLKLELEPIIELLKSWNALKILDFGCGTGGHAIGLAQAGFEVIAVDISPGMIEKAKIKAKKANLEIDFRIIDAFNWQKSFQDDFFDAILILGNTIVHFLKSSERKQLYNAFFALSSPHAHLIFGMKHYPALVKNKQRFLRPIIYKSSDQKEFIMLRLFDFIDKETVIFNVVYLVRPAFTTERVLNTPHSILSFEDMKQELSAEGFKIIQVWQNFQKKNFDPEQSEDLVLIAEKAQNNLQC